MFVLHVVGSIKYMENVVREDLHQALTVDLALTSTKHQHILYSSHFKTFALRF